MSRENKECCWLCLPSVCRPWSIEKATHHVSYFFSILFKWCLAILSLVPLACYVWHKKVGIKFNNDNDYDRLFVLAACVMLTVVLLFLLFQQCRVIAYKEAGKSKKDTVREWNDIVETASVSLGFPLANIEKSIIKIIFDAGKCNKMDEMTALALYHPDIYFQVKKMEVWKSLLEKQHELLKDNPAYGIFGRAND